MRGGFRSAVVLAAAIIASSAYVAVRVYGWPNGHVLAPSAYDFHPLIWAPVRGLLRGYDIYASHGQYVQAFHPRNSASAHPPFVLLLFGIFALPPLHQAWLLFVVLGVGCLWGALWLLAAPRTAAEQVAVAIVGVVLVCGGWTEHLLELGQLTAVATLGLALVMRYRTGWRGVVGVLLMATVPQTAVPLSILLVRGRVRAVLGGWVLAAALSIPPLVLLINATGSVRSAAHSMLSVLGRPAAHAPDRIDVVGRLLGHDLWVSVALLAALAVVVAVRRWTIGPTDIGWLLLAVTATTLVWYHQPYDLVMVGAVAGALLVRSTSPPARAAGAVYGLASLAVTGIVIEAVSSAAGVSILGYWDAMSRSVPLVILVLCLVDRLVARRAQVSSPRASSSPSARCP